MEYQYTYLIYSTLFATVWIVLYFWRKDARKEMLMISILFALAGPGADFLLTKDYWKPPTITGTAVGVESLIIGFFLGGVSSVLYEEIFKKRLAPRTEHRYQLPLRFLSSVYLLAFIYFMGFYILQLNSFYSAMAGLFIPSVIMGFRRKDLIADSVMTGISLTAVGTLIYLILQFLQPGYIQAIWVLNESWYTNLVLGIPLGEYLFYFALGLFIGPLYEYLQDRKLIKIN